MARTALTVQSVTDAGVEPSLSAFNVDGHSIPGDGDTLVEIVNGDVDTCTVTIQTGGTYHGKAVADTTVAIPTGETRIIGRFKPALYNQPSDNLVYIDIDDETSVTVTAYNIGA